MSDQTQIDPFRELNRYDDHDKDFRSRVVYEPPRRTLEHGWRKFHATRDCGRAKVNYVEQTTHRPGGEKWEFDLYCWECGHRVDEDEILFIGGQWYTENGWQTYGKGIERLYIPPARVLELGPDPDRDELRNALELGRIEREAAVPHMFSFGRDVGDGCEDCGASVPVRFDGRCRMCYDGPWTDRLTDTIATLARAVRERNHSFAHRLPTQLSPTEPGGAPSCGTILWRRHDAEGTPKLVQVSQRLEDTDSGHMEYVLWDPTHTERWQYHEDDLEDCFWDTGINVDHGKPVGDERVQALWERVRGR